MSISVDWGARVIYVPKTFLSAVTATLFELDVDQFRLALKGLEDSPEGMSYPDTHRHNTEIVLSGVTYARSVEVVNGYTVTFEDGQYAVRCVGANHNLADVKNLNQVSLIIGNSAGLIVGGGGGGGATAAEVWAYPARTLTAAPADITDKLVLIEAILRNKSTTDPVSGLMTIYATDGVTPLLTAQLYENVGGTQAYRGQGAERRERLA